MTYFLFPGQGSQAPGMGKDFHQASAPAREALDTAETILGPGFLDTVFNGTPEEVTDTRIAQTALVAVGVAIARHLESRGLQPDGCAGHSVGEIAALVVAQSLAFEDALRLTRERARLMAEEAPEGTMAAVMGMAPEAIEEALSEGDAGIANYNGPQQTIIAGTRDAVEAATAVLEDAGAKRVMPLRVSGAFHSSLMRKPAEQFGRFVEDLEFRAPQIRFVSSVTGQQETDPGTLKKLLARQLDSPVRWTDVMNAIGPVPAIETGPGNTLKGLARRTEGAPKVALAGTLDLADAIKAP